MRVKDMTGQANQQTNNPGNDDPVFDLPTKPDDLFRVLDKLEIAYTVHHHPAVFTVKESELIEKDIPGAHCRNLYLRDKKKKNFLVVALNETTVDLKALQAEIESDRLSFGSAERLFEFLGVRPGSVCPFSIINDPDRHVRLILDKAMMQKKQVNYHPLDNRMTVGLSPDDLLKFIDFCGHTPHIIDFEDHGNA